jgi:hypothetical protein
MQDTIDTDRGPAQVYRAGAPAYLDSFGGLLPVTVLEVITAGFGYQVAPRSGEITVRLNVTRAGYTRGEVVTSGAYEIVPRGQVRLRQYSSRIDPLYAWARSVDPDAHDVARMDGESGTCHG